MQIDEVRPDRAKSGPLAAVIEQLHDLDRKRLAGDNFRSAELTAEARNRRRDMRLFCGWVVFAFGCRK